VPEKSLLLPKTDILFTSLFDTNTYIQIDGLAFSHSAWKIKIKIVFLFIIPVWFVAINVSETLRHSKVLGAVK
jgi:hypothetical protein